MLFYMSSISLLDSAVDLVSIKEIIVFLCQPTAVIQDTPSDIKRHCKV